jgi:hypothetical protein
MHKHSPARRRVPPPLSFHAAPPVVAWVLTRPRSGPGWRAYHRQDVTTAGSASAAEAPLPQAIAADIAMAESASRGVS